MKNTPTELEPSAAWREALALFDRDLRRRGASEPTRRAYGVDVGQLALWATATASSPPRSPTGSCAATPPHSRSARVARHHRRPQAGGHPRVLPQPGGARRDRAEPRRPGARAQAASAPPARAEGRRGGEAARPHPGHARPLELRDRALFELAYSAGLRARELVDLDVESVDFDAEEIRVEGKGGKTRIVPAGEPALRAVERYLERARHGPERRRRASRRCSSRSPGRRLLHERRAPPSAAWTRRRGGAGRRLAARPAAFLRDASSGGRRRSAQHSGASGPREHLYDPGLHSGRVSRA